MAGLAEGVKPLVERMRQLALQSLVLGVDETPVTMLGGESNGSVKSYLWGTVGDEAHPYDCFYFTSDRSRSGPDQFLSGYEGYLQSDAYIGYEVISAASAAILKVGCWAHARRKFEEIQVTAPSVATHTALGYFQRLYEIEGRGRERACVMEASAKFLEPKSESTNYPRVLITEFEGARLQNPWKTRVTSLAEDRLRPPRTDRGSPIRPSSA
jgi:hypothetical protein